MKLFRILSSSFVIAVIAAAPLVLSGCGPDYNAISNRLRQQTIDQDRQITDLKEKISTRDTVIQGLRSDLEKKSPPLQTLPQQRLSDLFTAARLQIQPTTSISDLDGAKGPIGFRVFIRTLTDDGMVFPATGTLTIEAFELPPSPAAPTRIGTWNFSPEQMKQNWFSGLGLNHFAFNCPWPPAAPPAAGDVQFRATCVDALTGATLTAQLTKHFPPQ